MEQRKETQQGSKRTLFMILCCLVPMLLVVLLFTVGIGGILPFLMILLCPLMHIIMMRGMHGGHDHKHSNSHVISTGTSAKQLGQMDDITEPMKSVNAEPDLTDGQAVERR
jgi:hypothetical protein